MTSSVGQTTLTIYLVNLPDALICSGDCAIMFREKLFACAIITKFIYEFNMAYYG